MHKILLVDDDVELLALLSEYFKREGFEVTAHANGESGLAAALAGRHTLAVLDVMMPGTSGIDLLRQLRASGSTLPVIMLTARGDDDDRILGLELGADDYVPKPCTPRELSARIRAILRRAAPPTDDIETPLNAAGELQLWPAQRQASRGKEALALTSTEFNLLEVLAQHVGRVVSKEDLSLQALGRPLVRYDRSIDVHISSLRQKLGVLEDGRSCIQTIYRQGYQLLP